MKFVNFNTKVEHLYCRWANSQLIHERPELVEIKCTLSSVDKRLASEKELTAKNC